MKSVYLTSIKKIKELREKAINVFDVETNTHGFFKLVSYARLQKSKAKNEDYKTEVMTFYDFDEFINFLWLKRVNIIYCYNIKFDSRFIPNYLIKNLDVDFRFIESSSQLLGVIIQKKINGKIQKIIFKDFFPFCLTSLENISKTFGCKFPKYPNFNEEDKKKLKILWDNFFENCSLEELKHHCENDVLILSELIFIYRNLFFKLFSLDILDNKIYSLASLTMKIFRSNYITNKIDNSFLKAKYNEDSKKWKYFVDSYLEKFVRMSYKGGYTANFSNQQNYDVVSYDINSSYPYQSTRIKFPIGLAYFTLDFDLWLDFAKEIPAFAKVIVNFNHEKYFIPVLRSDGKLGRFYGKYEGVLTSFELKWLDDHNINYEFIEGYYFVDYDSSFAVKRFCEDLFDKKLIAQKEGKQDLRQIFKILLNSLTGKFGQKMEMKVRYNLKFLKECDVTSLDYDNEYKKVLSDIYFSFQEQNRISIKTYQIPSWISLITALGRIQLMNMIFKTNALYCDSDSVYCLRKNSIQLNNSEELGKWKLEHNIGKFRALAPKLYVFEDLGLKFDKNDYCIKLKGIPYDFHNKKLFDEIWNYKEGNKIIIENIPRFCSIKESLNRVNVLEEHFLLKYDEITKKLNPQQKV